MTKEDYMKLSKERLAELLAEKDSCPSENTPLNDPIHSGTLYDPRPLCGFGGYCTNKFRDCVNCPGVYSPLGSTIIQTSTHT